MVICLELGADLHMAQLMPLPLTVSYFSKIQFGFAFLVPAHPGSPGKRAVKRVYVCVCIVTMIILIYRIYCAYYVSFNITMYLLYFPSTATVYMFYLNFTGPVRVGSHLPSLGHEPAGG